MTTPLLGKSFIGFSRGMGTEPCGQAINPATNEKLDPVYHSATPEEVVRALDLAAAAFPVYAAKSGVERAGFLRAIASGIEARVEDLVARTPLESALPEPRIRGEAGRTIGQLRMFAGLVETDAWADPRIERAEPDRQPLPKPDLRSMQVPLGPVAVFCASNFPLAFSVAGGDTASALAAGCPVIVIAHHSHPGSAEIVAHAVIEAAQATGMPEGVFSVLYGGGRKVGAVVVNAPAVQAVGFTGSRAGGTALMKAAAARPQPIPVYAEMSAVNPVVILPSALAEPSVVANGYFGSLTLGCGQFCTNPGLVFLPEDGSGAFLEILRPQIEAATPAVMLNPSIAAAYAEATAAVAAQPGVSVLARATASTTPNTAPPVVMTVSAADFAANPELQQEMFGPACLIVVGDAASTLAALGALEGQLTASIFGSAEEIAASSAIVDRLRALSGRLIFNGFPTGVEVCSSMVHGGPFPATSDGRSTSVGTMAIHRFCRAAAWQGAPMELLPPALRD
ncbi:MAG: aldehyde dehydrogenase (NADP(+)) [Luteolibacter sp.]